MDPPAEDEKAQESHHSLSGLDEAEAKKAAEILQRTYRGHRTRRQLQGFSLDASTRWYETVKDAQYQNLTTPAPPRARLDSTESPATDKSERKPTNNPAKDNWVRATQITRHAWTDDSSPSSSGVSGSDTESDTAQSQLSAQEREDRRKKKNEANAKRKQYSKMMGLEYFLEMVDQKHRYGSNLRKYHAYWKTQDTSQNFFYWLDQGDGRDVSLEECSRTRLDKMQVRYLSREERMRYLVKIDNEGLLRWAKNNELVWTKDELYRDSLDGIVPVSDPTPMFKYNIRPSQSSSSSSESDEDDNTAPDEGQGYVNEEFHRARGLSKIKYVTAGALFNHMIRSSLKKGHKWIFVADTSFRLYIGYKQSGAFQHSSFLNGSRITAAGLIKVKHGQLRSLSPLSGHYRPPAANFKLFVQSLKDEGVDMSRVSISKSYAVLVGMEGYQTTKKKIKEAEHNVSHESDRIFRPEKARADEEKEKDKSKSAEKERAYLEEQRRKEMAERAEMGRGKKVDESLSRKFSKAMDGLRHHKET